MSVPGSNLDEALEEEGYVRWVQTGTCIGFAKKGLESFVLHRSQILHQRIKCNIQNTSSYANMCQNISISRTKHNHTIPGSNNMHNWTTSCFPGCRGCQLYINELVSVCAGGFMFSQKNWDNSNISLWPVSEWEVAKVYMNPGQDKNILKPEDTDLCAILNFIERCSVSSLAFSNIQSVQKVRESRNAIMHSPTFTATPQQLKEFTDSMIDLLTDNRLLLFDKGALEAVSHIKETKGPNFTITTDAEFRVLRDRALELQRQNEIMQENVKDMQDQCDDLKDKDDQESQTTLAQLVKDIDDKENSLQELKSTFSKLEHFASRSRDLQTKMKKHTTVTATALYETKEMLTNVKKSYRALTKQEQDIIDDATDKCETVEEKYDVLQKLTESLIAKNKDITTENENSLKQKQQEIDDMKRKLQDCTKDYERAEKNINTAKMERDRLASEKQNLQKNLDKLLGEKRMQDDSINDLTAKKILLETEIKETKQQLDLRLKEIDSLTNSNHKLESEIRNLTKQVEQYKNEIESIKLKQAETQTEFQTLLSEKKQLVADKLERDGKIKDLQLQNSQLETSLRKSQIEGKTNEENLERIKRENKALKLHVYNLGREKMKLTQTLESALEKINGMSTKNDDLKLENKELKEQLEQYKNELDSVKQEKIDAVLELQNLFAELNELIAVKLGQDNNIKELKEKNAVLEADLRQGLIVNETVRKELDRLKGENRTLERQNQQLKLDIVQTKQQLRITVIKNTDLNKMIENINKQVLHLKEKNEDLQCVKMCLQKQLNQVESQNQKLTTEVLLLTSQNARFKKDIDGVSGLKQQNDRLKMTDTTIFRIWSLSVILYIIAFVAVYWLEVLQI